VSRGLLIDTCALIWIAALAGDAHLGPAEDAMDEAREKGLPICLSPMSAWEIGMLAAKGRLPMPMPPRVWLERLMSGAGIVWADMPVDVLLASSTLPGDPHGDPADRIIMATAREFGLRVITRDRKILDYAAKGHVLALEC
jgi:PIN domain nuclease of toxin-antitoxin system